MNETKTLDVSAGTLNIHAGTSLNPTKEGLRGKGCSNESWEALKGLRIKKGIVWINGDKKEALHTSLAINLGQYICCLEPQCHLSEDTTTFIEFLTSKGTYALSWKPCQGDSLNLPDHRTQDRKVGKDDQDGKDKDLRYGRKRPKSQRQ
ncbi:hypothetical protein Tco_1311440 [Tanacetum coccineum]